jgi:hypothetical protein
MQVRRTERHCWEQLGLKSLFMSTVRQLCSEFVPYGTTQNT